VYNVYVFVSENVYTFDIAAGHNSNDLDYVFFHELHLRHSQDVRARLRLINDKPESSIDRSSYVAV